MGIALRRRARGQAQPVRAPRAPDFVGVGSQRSGTTWWSTAIAAHPEVDDCGDPATKEQHFFDTFHARPMTDADVGRYHALFARPPGAVAGEWTPSYMADPWTPRLLARAAPDAKILVMLRDPVERFRSGLLWQLRWFGDIEDPLAMPLIARDAFHRCRYGEQLRRVHRHFPADRILVLQYERCFEDPEGEFARTLRFLGLSAGWTPDLSAPVGEIQPDKPPLGEDVRDDLVETLAPDVAELARLVPDLDLGLWGDFRGRV